MFSFVLFLMCMSIYLGDAWEYSTHGTPKKVSGPLELELQTVTCCPVGAGNWKQVIWKNALNYWATSAVPILSFLCGSWGLNSKLHVYLRNIIYWTKQVKQHRLRIQNSIYFHVKWPGTHTMGIRTFCPGKRGEGPKSQEVQKAWPKV